MTASVLLRHPVTPAMPDRPAKVRPPVLCVDDELHVLQGIERTLQSRFAVTAVSNAADAIVALQLGGPFAVIVCDFRLAETDGVRLLTQVREIAPMTVRLLLTGHASMDDAIAAINEGHIFGFVRKPCRPDLLVQRVSDAVAQHRLLTVEQDLLEKTLHGAIKALTDLMAVSCPVAAARATRVTRYACDIAVAMRVERWEIEIAGMVSQIGCMTLPPELIERVYRGATLEVWEQALVDRLPTIARNILGTIPRLEGVCAILGHMGDRFDLRPIEGRVVAEVPIGARILRVASDFDTLVESRGVTIDDAVRQLGAVRGVYDPRAVEALATASAFFVVGLQTHEILLCDVEVGMVFVSDVLNPAGLLIIARGQDLTAVLRERVRNQWSSFAERMRVRVIATPTV
ncbi:MAG TPA: HD domain-containing phosphohydrolase [Gemmatimonadaceae bacterium]|nr:HD domain-containing phosphohydrolase [Gemmatimonadaceae bacterium]